MEDDVQALILHVRVVRGVELPKTELISEIDPWVKVIFPDELDEDDADSLAPVATGTRRAPLLTRKVDNDANPVWNDNFFIPVTAFEGKLEGCLRFELWAKGIFGDQFCGHSHIDLRSVPYGSNRLQRQLPLAYADDKQGKFGKQGRNSGLVVELLGSMMSLESLSEYLSPSAFHSPGYRDVYMPLDRERGLYCGVHYTPRSVNFSVFMGKKNSNHVDIAYYGGGLDEPYVVARRSYQDGKKVFPGVTCYEEAVIMGLPLCVDFSNLLMSVEERKAKEYFHVDEVLNNAEWPGPLADYNKAAQAMSGMEGTISDGTAIYIACGLSATRNSSASASNNGSNANKSGTNDRSSKRVYSMLKLDYQSAGPSYAGEQVLQWISGSGRGLKGLYLCVTRIKQGSIWEWMNPDAASMETLSMTLIEPEPLQGGRYNVLRKVKLATSDVQDPKEAMQIQLDSFIVRYSVKNYMDWSVFEMLDPRGEWVDEEEEEEVEDSGPLQVPKQMLDNAASLSSDMFRGLGAGAIQVTKGAGTLAAAGAGVLTGAGKMAAEGAGVLTGALSVGVKSLTTGVMTLGFGRNSSQRSKAEEEEEEECVRSGHKKGPVGVQHSKPSSNRAIAKSRWQSTGTIDEEDEDVDDACMPSTKQVMKKVGSTHKIAMEARDKLAERQDRLRGLDQKAAEMEVDAKEFAALARQKRAKAAGGLF